MTALSGWKTLSKPQTKTIPKKNHDAPNKAKSIAPSKSILSSFTSVSDFFSTIGPDDTSDSFFFSDDGGTCLISIGCALGMACGGDSLVLSVGADESMEAAYIVRSAFFLGVVVASFLGVLVAFGVLLVLPLAATSSTTTIGSSLFPFLVALFLGRGAWVCSWSWCWCWSSRAAGCTSMICFLLTVSVSLASASVAFLFMINNSGMNE